MALSREAGKLVKAPRLSPAWRPGPLANSAVPDKYRLPRARFSPGEMVGSLGFGLLVASPLMLFTMPLWAFVASVGGGFSMMSWWRVRRLRKLRTSLTQAFELLDRGEFDAAEVLCREVAATERNPIVRTAIADFGYIALRRGDYDTALAVYSETWRRPRLPSRLRAHVAGALATAYALNEDIEAALDWLPSQSRLIVPVPLAVVWARRQAFERVLSLKMPTLEQWESGLLKHEARVLALMHAFAKSQLGSDPAEYADALAEATTVYEGEYDYLTKRWPELRRFVNKHVHMNDSSDSHS